MKTTEHELIVTLDGKMIIRLTLKAETASVAEVSFGNDIESMGFFQALQMFGIRIVDERKHETMVQ